MTSRSGSTLSKYTTFPLNHAGFRLLSMLTAPVIKTGVVSYREENMDTPSESFLAKDVNKLLAQEGRIAALMLLGQAAGAIPNGSRIRKIKTEPGDSYQDGTEGTVLSSLDFTGAPDVPHPFAYFISWDPDPNVPVLIGGHRIEAV